MAEKITFFTYKNKIYPKKYFCLHISSSYAKYWVKNYFAHGRFPEVGQKQKTEKKRKRERERLNDGNNNGQLCIANATSGGARKAAWAKNMKVFLK